MKRKLTARQKEELIDRAIESFKGHSGELEKAIGMLFVGKHVGWKPLLLIHDKKTIRKYEEILDIDIREVMDEVGPRADKSAAWRVAKGLGNFWKAVKGGTKGVRSPLLEG